MEKIKDLVLAYYHSKESHIEEKKVIHQLKVDLEKLEKNQRTTDDKLRISVLKDEIRASEHLIEEREAELKEVTSDLLEALKEADLEVDEIATFHLYEESYLDVRRTGEDSIILSRPYTKI